MIKKLICIIWGHKTVIKAYNGNTIRATNSMGYYYEAPLYTYKKLDYCIRCGKNIKKEYNE